MAKVDALMALCDRLEAEQAKHAALKVQGVASTLHHLSHAETPEDFGQSFTILNRQFNHWFDDLATVKTLRATLLQLAVQGKLVEQNPSDEPASELLTRIEAEKQQLIKSGKIKKPKPLPPITEADQPFRLPQGWEWVRLGSFIYFENGDRSKNYPSKAHQVSKGIPFINAGHLQNGRISLSDMNFITSERYDLLRGGKTQIGDFLFCLRGSLGKYALVDEIERAAIASSLVILRPHIQELSTILEIYLRSPLSVLMISRFDNGTAQPNLSATDLKLFSFPLPPLAEQQRIVAKVGALMQLCDQLEAQITHSRTTNTQLMDSLLHHLTQAA